jgi:glycosyltransferase involved in cell wall biosynthesis
VIPRNSKVRILFICGAAEPGRCGVGDYTLRLAHELGIRGVQCAVIAVNDRFVQDSPTRTRSGHVEIARLPYGISWADRRHEIANFAEEFAASWISLQFVPYAHHPKGLAFRFAAILDGLFPQQLVHVMFHEVWIGWQKGASLRHRLLGAMQRRIIRAMCKSLRIQVADTSNEIYRRLLATIGVHAELSPIFSNIEPVGDGEFSRRLEDSSAFTGIFFGNISDASAAHVVLAEAAALVQRGSQRIRFVAVGHFNERSELILKDLARRFAESIEFCMTGGLTPRELSHWLRNADFGITTWPSQLLGKSGTVAAMRAHGLPIVAPASLPEFAESRRPGDGVFCHIEDVLNYFATRNQNGIRPWQTPATCADTLLARLGGIDYPSEKKSRVESFGATM